jgi:hypothetical protein
VELFELRVRELGDVRGVAAADVAVRGSSQQMLLQARHE